MNALPFQRSGRLLSKRFRGYFAATLLVALSSNLAAAVDQVIVGNMLGPRAMAAVGLTLPFTYGISVIYLLFSIGGSIMSAVAMGRRETREASAAFSASIWLITLIGLSVTFFGLLRIDALTYWLAGSDAQLAPMVKSYLRPLVTGVFFLLIVPGCGEFVRLDGQPKLVSAILVCSNAVNLICDVIFIKLLGDVSGAAWATVVGYIAGFLCLGFYVRSPSRTLRFTPPGFALLRLVAPITSGGLAGAVDMAFFMARSFFMNSIVLSLGGERGMAAFSACLACMSLSFIFVAGAAQTMMPIAGVLRGEEDAMGIRFIMRQTLAFAVGGSLVLCVVFEAFPAAVLGAFGLRSAEELSVAVPALRIFSPSLAGLAVTSVMIYYYQTIGRPSMSLFISVMEALALQISTAWLLSRFFGLTGAWASFPLTEAICVVMILCVARAVSKRSGGNLSGFLLLPVGGNERLLDVTIPARVEEAEALSAKIAAFGASEGLDAGLAMRLGVAVEEMAVNTIRYGYGAGPSKTIRFIDVALQITDGGITLSLRDDGRPFDPTTYSSDEAEKYARHGLDVVRAISSRVEYSYTLGFNNSVIHLDRRGGAAAEKEEK